MRKITTNPRLKEKRNEFIRQLYAEGFFCDEIGEMFRLQKSRVHQIVNPKVGPRKKIKKK